MLQPFKRNFLQHALAVSAWMQQHEAKGGMDPRSLSMEIAHNGRAVRFYPQFVAEQPGGIGFVPHLQPAVSGFVGWLPYFGKGWEESRDKLAFKRFAQAHGLIIPAWSQNVADVKGPFLVKHRHSTLGRSQRGPYVAAPPPASQTQVTLADGEYCEQFVFGLVLKAWYWNGQPTVVEAVPMPTIQGDGASTPRQLIASRLPQGAVWPEVLTILIQLQGQSVDAVLERDKTIVADYRYMSELNPSITADHNIRARIAGTGLEQQLLQAGELCLACVPAALRENVAFSLDGIVDDTGQIHFLEMNCNPLLHPAFYLPMLDSLFAASTPPSTRP